MNDAFEVHVSSIDELHPTGVAAYVNSWREPVRGESLRVALLQAAEGRGSVVRLGSEISLGRAR